MFLFFYETLPVSGSNGMLTAFTGASGDFT